MSTDYLELTAKQEQVLVAGFPERPSDAAPRAIIAHGATGAGKRLAALAGFINWATTTRRHNHFIIIIPSSYGILELIDRIKSIVGMFGDFEAPTREKTQQWVKIGSNYFHMYPYQVYYGDHSRYIGTITFKNFIPESVLFLAADRYDQSFVEHVVSQIPEAPAMLWASVDAGDTGSYWYEDYIIKGELGNVLAIHFDLDDVGDNPGVNDRWRMYMLERAQQEGETTGFKSYVSGRWISGPESILSGLDEGSLAEQAIESQLSHREAIARAKELVEDLTPELVKNLEELTFRATIERKLPYPYINYEEGEGLISKLRSMLSSTRREVRSAASAVIEEAHRSGADVSV